VRLLPILNTIDMPPEKNGHTNNYGAVDLPTGNDHYDEGNTRYLNETPFQWGRCFRAAVPIAIALLVMGGFAYGMSHGFDHLYGPAKSGDENNNVKYDTSWIPVSEDMSDATSSEGGSKKCSEHANCSSLQGNCCPTDEGVMLECCG